MNEQMNKYSCVACILVSRPPEERELITVTYLNPLVLRKELENMFENDGVDKLQSPNVVHDKTDIFWNLVSRDWKYIFYLVIERSALVAWFRRSLREFYTETCYFKARTSTALLVVLKERGCEIAASLVI